MALARGCAELCMNQTSSIHWGYLLTESSFPDLLHTLVVEMRSGIVGAGLGALQPVALARECEDHLGFAVCARSGASPMYGITLTFQHRGDRSNVSRRAAFPGQLRLCRAQPTATAQRRDKPSAPRQTEMLDRLPAASSSTRDQIAHGDRRSCRSYPSTRAAQLSATIGETSHNPLAETTAMDTPTHSIVKPV